MSKKKKINVGRFESQRKGELICFYKWRLGCEAMMFDC